MAVSVPITQRRMEAKYTVPLNEVAAVETALSSFATPIEYVKGQSAACVTTVYLDRPDLSLARAALLNPSANEKIRSREYFTHDESLVPSVWIEWKARRETWGDKRRFALPKERFSALCAGTLSEEVVRLAQPAGNEIAGVEAFRKVLACARGILVPRFAATCVRRTFHIHSPRIRVTLDTSIRFHRVPRTPYMGPGALSARRLGEAFYEMQHALLEVKTGSEMPAELKELVRRLARTMSSKFVVGSRHLLSM